MKKITSALLAAVCSVGMAYSQTNISIEAPVHNTNYIDLLPMGSSDEATLTAVYLYNHTDLSALTGTALTSLGMQIYRGVIGTAVTGSLTIFLKNTTDMTYNAGSSFTSAITSMTNVYSANYTIPSTQNSSTLNLTFPQTFTYTGSGIYVGVRWTSTGPFVTSTASTASLAAYPANGGTPGTDMGAIEEVAVGTPPTDVMSTTPARPSFLFRATNTATNEAAVDGIVALGKVAKSNPTHIIQAVIRNGSINTLSNVSASLAVTGANSFSNVQTIPSIPAGGSVAVSFAAFSPTVMGINHVSVTTSSDQNNANNQLTWTQSVTCNVMANNPPDLASAFTGGVGFPNTGGIFATEFVVGSTATLTGIRISISSDAATVGKHLYGVLIDNGGTVIGNTDSITITAGMLSTFQTFKWKPGQGQILNANSAYLIGLAQPETGFYPMAYEPGTHVVPGTYLATSNLSGGTFGISSFGYYGIEPVLGPDVSIAALTSSVFCLGDAIVLNGDGASTYTWTAAPNTTVNTISTPSAANISVTPTRTETVTFTLKGADSFGCVNSTTISAKVTTCTVTGYLNNALNNDNLVVYPNPAVAGKSTVGGLLGTNTITVYNVLGESIFVKTTSDEKVNIDLSAQPQGTYLVKITDTQNHSKTVKIVNQN